ncbi:GNAT family N-acetyltransferase [Mesobacillus subterraneus]
MEEFPWFSMQLISNGEIAYWIGEEYWGKGYPTEA